MIFIGIQGGEGSYSHQACKKYCKVNQIERYKFKFLYTTEEVLYKLHIGKVNFGLFAISDSQGSLVEESVQALTKYNCKIVDKFPFEINHTLISKKDIKPQKLKHIITHPQIYKQCKKALRSKYPELTYKIGKGNLVDQALVAKKLANGELDSNIATIGSNLLAELYPNLYAIDKSIQDSLGLSTTFIFCKRRYIV